MASKENPSKYSSIVCIRSCRIYITISSMGSFLVHRDPRYESSFGSGLFRLYSGLTSRIPD